MGELSPGPLTTVIRWDDPPSRGKPSENMGRGKIWETMAKSCEEYGKMGIDGDCMCQKYGICVRTLMVEWGCNGCHCENIG